MVKTITIVSLSSGIAGESSVRLGLDIGIKRLKEYGLNIRFMPNALKGSEYVRRNPDKRAEDLLNAFRDPETYMILCAIGGDDTYRLLPYLFRNNELANAVSNKIFLGFSDTLQKMPRSEIHNNSLRGIIHLILILYQTIFLLLSQPCP